jgi:AbrB family looped-hinge helix DNA binding protein
MSTVMKISSQGQIRIPQKIMNSLGIGKGDYVEVNVEESQIVLKPRKLIDPTQSWYWTPEWQAKEREADLDLSAGKYHEFDTVEELLNDLHNENTTY